MYNMITKNIHINKTVSRNFIMDFVASIQNTFGLNLTSYQKMVDKAMNQIKEELGERELSWFRYEIAQISKGVLSVTLYGELK